MEDEKLRILVTGAGIAGLTAAHFLLRTGHHVTVIERTSSLRTGGQSVDIRGHGLKVLQRMSTDQLDVEALVHSRCTKEKGLRFVDSSNRCRAEFPVDDGSSFTSEVEIMRGDLTLALYESAKQFQRFRLVCNTTIESIDYSGSSMPYVTLTSHAQSSTDALVSSEYDVVIAADGIASSTRNSVIDEEIQALQDLGQWSCWFSIPREDSDDLWARWFNAPNGRMILVRPDPGQVATRVSLWTMTRSEQLQEDLTRLSRSSIDDQKEYWAEIFKDAGWESARVIDGLKKSSDFYAQKIAQVKLNTFWKDRVVMVGDAAYCPSPISGMGVTTAMTGAYVLAGEINRSSRELDKAFKAYEEKIRPFVTVAQKLAPGTPSIANPESAIGIWLLHCFLGFIAWTRLYRLLGSSVNPPSKAMILPDYENNI